MKIIVCLLLLLTLVGCDSKPNPGYSNTPESKSETAQSKLSRFGIRIMIPYGWLVPAATIGSGVGKVQDGQRTVSAIVHEVYLSPQHGKNWGEIELSLFEIDARSWLNAMVIQPENWLPVQGDRLLTYFTSDNTEVVGTLIPFGNASAVKFRVSRTLRGLSNQEIGFTEDLFYCSCGDMLLRIQMRSDPVHFARFEASVFEAFQQHFICSRPRS